MKKNYLIMNLIVVLYLVFVNNSYATIINVPDDYPTIQEGINASVNGDTVLVQPGTYVENINFNGKNITVASLFLTTQDTSYTSQTIIDGNQNGSVVTFESYEDTTAVLTGFTITNGYAPDGGGIWCSYPGPSLRNLIVVNNTTNNRGGGIVFFGSNSRLENIFVCENTSETDEGGGIYCSDSELTMENLKICWNIAHKGGGIYSHSSNLYMNNVEIYNNTAQQGGGGYIDSSPTLKNVTIFNNSAIWGAGLYLYYQDADPGLINVTIHNNTAENYGGGIYLKDGPASANLLNTIMWNDLPEEIRFDNCSQNALITIAYSDIQGGEEGIVTNWGDQQVNWLSGNIDSDPLFVDGYNGDFHLTVVSPCIDAGDPDPQYNDPDGTRNDMGAYYFDQTQNYFDISGNIGYFSDGDAVPNTILELTGDNNYSTTTDESGDYYLFEIYGGSYISTPSKTNDLGGLSGLDASRIARYSALLYELDCLQMVIADVSMNGSISGMDASRVARYSVGTITELNPEGINWVFTPELIPECDDWPPIVYENTREYTPLDSDLIEENFISIRLGDVSGNWSPDNRMPLTQKSSPPGADPSEETTVIETSINSTLRIPVVIDEVTPIEGIDISIAFNPEVVKLRGLTLNEGIVDNKDYAIETNLEESGKGTMVIYAQKELVSESGVVAFIEFDIIGEVGSKSEVYFTKFDLNETEASGGLQVVSEGKEVTTKRLEVNVRQNLPEKFAFYQNYPNPFSTNTLIRYDLPEDVHVNIQIYNVKGQLIEELFNGVESAGRKKIEWNVLEKSGMSSGIYFYKLSTKDKTFIKKMILMR